MPLDNLASVVGAGFLSVAVVALSSILLYSSIRVRPLPPEVLQLWLFTNSKAVADSSLLLSLGVLVGLVGFILDMTLPVPLEDSVVLIGALACAGLTLLGTWKALWVLRQVRESVPAKRR